MAQSKEEKKAGAKERKEKRNGRSDKEQFDILVERVGYDKARICKEGDRLYRRMSAADPVGEEIDTSEG